MPQIGPNDIAAKFVLIDEISSKVKDIERNIDRMAKETEKNGDKTKKVFDAWNFTINAVKLGLKGLKFVLKESEQAQLDLAAAQTVFGDAADSAYLKAKEGASELTKVLGEVADAFAQGIFGGPKIKFFANMANDVDEFSIRAKAAEIRIGKLKTTLADLQKVPANVLEAGIVTGFDEGSDEWRNVADFYSKWRQEIVDTAQESVDLETQVQGFMSRGFSEAAAKKIVTSYAALRKSIADDRAKRQAEDDQLEIESAERVAKAFADVNEDEAKRAADAWNESLSGAWSNSTKALEDEFLKTSRIVDRFAKEAHATLSQNLFDAVTGEAITFAGVMRSILLSVTRQFTDATAAGFLGLFGGGGSGNSSIFRGLLGNSGGSGSAGQGYGGPPEAFAEGGTVRRPTLAIIGEGGEPEDIVPHSKRAEYVAKHSGGGMSLTVNVAMSVNAIDGANVQNFLARNDVGRGIGDAVIRRLSTDPAFARAFR